VRPSTRSSPPNRRIQAEVERAPASQLEFVQRLKADVICVSDGIIDVSPEAQTKWARRSAERGMRAYGILIGANQGEALLDEIIDVVFWRANRSASQCFRQRPHEFADGRNLAVLRNELEVRGADRARSGIT